MKVSPEKMDWRFFLKSIIRRDGSAFVDGKETEIIRANYVLRALPIPAGKHTVEFKFQPDAYVVGNKITICVFLADAGYCSRMHWMDLEERVRLAELMHILNILSAEEMQEVLLRSAEPFDRSADLMHLISVFSLR